MIIQHLAITLTALSLVRERLSGQMDRFRVAPVTSMEVLIGKYVAYGVLSLAMVGGLVGALLVGVLGVPMLGGWLAFAGIVLLLTFASLGIGLLISLVVDSERQAVQLSMIVLLASVFFSGFVLPVTDFADWARYLAYALPVTEGIAPAPGAHAPRRGPADVDARRAGGDRPRALRRSRSFGCGGSCGRPTEPIRRAAPRLPLAGRGG